MYAEDFVTNDTLCTFASKGTMQWARRRRWVRTRHHAVEAMQLKVSGLLSAQKMAQQIKQKRRSKVATMLLTDGKLQSAKSNKMEGAPLVVAPPELAQARSRKNTGGASAPIVSTKPVSSGSMSTPSSRGSCGLPEASERGAMVYPVRTASRKDPGG